MASSLRHVMLLAVALAPSASLQAAEESALYGQLSVGAVTAADLRNDNAAATAVFSPKTGWGAEGTLGYRAMPALRLELNVGHRRHGMDGSFARNARIACGSPMIPCLSGDVDGGRLAASSALVSAKWDVPLGETLTPYIGAGAGLTRLSLRGTTTGTVTAGQSQSVLLIDDRDTVAAYRVGAGVSIQLRSVKVVLDYTYMLSAKTDLAGDVPAAAFTIHDRFRSHAISIGAQFPF